MVFFDTLSYIARSCIKNQSRMPTWVRPIILTMEEAEFRTAMVEGSPGKSFTKSHWKHPTQNRAEGVAEEV
jgi:hypothetical protein